MDATEFNSSQPAASFAEICRLLLLHPQAFFTSMALTGGLKEPATFLLISVGIGALRPLMTDGAGAAVGFLLAGLLRAALATGALLLIAHHLFDSDVEAEPAFRVVAYAAAPSALWCLPLIGPLATLFVLYLLILGIREILCFDVTRATLLAALVVTVVSAVASATGAPGLASLLNPLATG